MSDSTPKRSIGEAFVAGSAWMVAVRWAIRILGLVNTYILVRLLNPSDFGIIAMAMIVVGFVETFAQAGQKLAIIRHSNPGRADFDTAWTMSIFFGVAVSVVILLIAPLTESYFREPRATLVMQCLALRPLIGGFENIGIVNFRRDLRFERQFLYLVSTKLVTLGLTIGAAIYYRNYWALVIGMVGSQAIMVLLSYILSSYRPWFSLEKLSELRSFSMWNLVRTVGLYFNDQVDQLAVGGFAGTATMGRYRVASDVSSMFAVEILDPVVAVLFPVMASVQADPAKMREVYFRVFQWTTIISISVSTGVALCANDIVDVLLGDKWGDVKPLVPWLAMCAGLILMSNSVYSAFDVTGRARISAQLQWVRFIFLAITVFAVSFLTKNVTQVAFARFAITLALTPTLFIALASVLDIPRATFVSTIWRPFIASLIMALCVLGLNQFIVPHGMLRLLLDAVAGASVFVVTMLGLWLLGKRAEGPEKFVWDAAITRLLGNR